METYLDSIKNFNYIDFIKEHKYKVIGILVIILIVIGIIVYIYFKKSDNLIERVYKKGDEYETIPFNKLPTIQDINSYSVFFWIYIDNPLYNLQKSKHILTVGDLDLNNNKSYPAIYLTENINNLIIYISTNQQLESVLVENIPIKKWCNICINVNLNSVSIFINSKLVKTSLLQLPAIKLPSDLHINHDGGFSGYMSTLTFTNDNLIYSKLVSNFEKGPGAVIPLKDESRGDKSKKTSAKCDILYKNHYENLE